MNGVHGKLIVNYCSIILVAWRRAHLLSCGDSSWRELIVRDSFSSSRHMAVTDGDSSLLQPSRGNVRGLALTGDIIWSGSYMHSRVAPCRVRGSPAREGVGVGSTMTWHSAGLSAQGAACIRRIRSWPHSWAAWDGDSLFYFCGTRPRRELNASVKGAGGCASSYIVGMSRARRSPWRRGHFGGLGREASSETEIALARGLSVLSRKMEIAGRSSDFCTGP